MANMYTQFSVTVDCGKPEIAAKLAEVLREPHPEFDCSICEVEQEKNGVWFWAMEGGDIEEIVERIADFQTKYPIPPVVLSYAYICDKPRPDEFGGGAVGIRDGNAFWCDAASLAAEHVNM